MAVATSPPRPASRATPSLRGVVLALFVASGAAGLIYQVVWSRELVLVFGNTTQAVATIVTAFMAGLGFGSLVGGRLADTSLRPLRLYGLVELAVAAMAALLPFAFSGLAEVYRGVWPSLVERPGQLAGVRFALALAAVAPATFLMGMTLPLLTRYLVRTLDEAGARLGELYAANTAGAMVGTLLGGFVLIEFLGLHLTSYLAVGLNVAAGLGALLLSRRWEASPDPAPAAARRERRARPEVPRDFRPRRRAVLAATFVSGFVSLALEVLWTRMLAEGTGSSIYIFTTILAIFLLGIALGSFLYRRFSRPAGERLGTLGLCLAGVGVLAQATVVLGSGMVGHVPFVVRTVVVLLPATVLMGYAFPLAGRLATPSAEAAGGSVGLLYAANTGGSILGSFGAAFVLAGTLGTNGSILLLGALNLLAGAALFAADPVGRTRAGAGSRRAGPGRGRVVAAGMAGLAVLGLVASSLDLPVTRTRTQNELLRTGLPVTHAEDELATVDTVGGPAKGRRLLVGGVGMTSLTVDTKLMGYLSKALRPDAEDFLVIAFGMGGTYRSGLQLGLRTDAVELSPTVPSRMPVFFPDGERVPAPPQGPGDRQRRPQLRPAVPRDLRHGRRRPRPADRERRVGGALHPRVPDRGQGPPAARRRVHALDPLRPPARRLQGARPHLRRRLRSRPPGALAGPARGVHVRLRRPARVRRAQRQEGPRRPRRHQRPERRARPPPDRRRRLGRGGPPLAVAGRRPAALVHRRRPADHRRPSPLRVLPLAPRLHGRPGLHQRLHAPAGRRSLTRPAFRRRSG